MFPVMKEAVWSTSLSSLPTQKIKVTTPVRTGNPLSYSFENFLGKSNPTPYFGRISERQRVDLQANNEWKEKVKLFSWFLEVVINSKARQSKTPSHKTNKRRHQHHDYSVCTRNDRLPYHTIGGIRTTWTLLHQDGLHCVQEAMYHGRCDAWTRARSLSWWYRELGL